MISKFMYKISFSLILFTVVTANSFGMDERQKQFACQNLSEEKMPRMSDKEFMDNIVRCTGITDQNCIKIIQNRLNPAEKNSIVDIVQKIALEGGRVASVGALFVGFSGFVGSLLNAPFCVGKSGQFAKTGATGFVGVIIFGLLDSYHKAFRMKK